MSLARLGRNVDTRASELQSRDALGAQSGMEITYKGLIGIAGLSTELMVEVRDHQGSRRSATAPRDEGAQQGHAIRAAGDGDNDPLAANAEAIQ